MFSDRKDEISVGYTKILASDEVLVKVRVSGLSSDVVGESVALVSSEPESLAESLSNLVSAPFSAGSYGRREVWSVAVSQFAVRALARLWAERSG